MAEKLIVSKYKTVVCKCKQDYVDGKKGSSWTEARRRRRKFEESILEKAKKGLKVAHILNTEDYGLVMENSGWFYKTKYIIGTL